MPEPYRFVALDLETTGLDARGDAIIEAAVLPFDVERIDEPWATLVQPDRRVSAGASRVSGLRDADLAGAPRFAEIADELRRRIAGRVVVAHNAPFDVSFLAAAGVDVATTAAGVYDTMELARGLLPAPPGMGLDDVAEALGLTAGAGRHRAAGDALLCARVFQGLWRWSAGLPPGMLLQAANAAAFVPGWGVADFLREVWAGLGVGVAAAGSPSAYGYRPPPTSAGAASARGEALGRSLAAPPELLPVGGAEVRAVFEAAGGAPDAFPGFELREEQLRMAESVAETLSDGGHLLVEAGTGTGKSLAYLVPAACFALRNASRVVVSTATKALQDQITDKDVPQLRRLLAHGAPADVQRRSDALAVARLKGRANYLCLQRFAALMQRDQLDDAEARLAVKVLHWLGHGGGGERDDIVLRSDEEYAWARVSAQDTSCLAQANSFVREGTCVLLRARRAAEQAQLVVTNHALLFTDLAADAGVLPSADHVVIDEAHKAEDTATGALTFEVRERDVTDLLQSAGGGPQTSPREGGFAHDLRTAKLGGGALDVFRAEAESLAAQLIAASGRAAERASELFRAVHTVVTMLSGESGDYEQTLRVTPGLRHGGEWESLELAWGRLAQPLHELAELLGRAGTLLGDVPDESGDARDRLSSDAAAQLARVQSLAAGLGHIFDQVDPDWVPWLSVDRNGTVALRAAPLDVAAILRDQLFQRKRSVILTSATLATGADFGYVQSRLGVPEPRTLLLGSPFDFQTAALVCVAADAPEPDAGVAYDRFVADAVDRFVRASDGRALVLFTSHRAVRTAARALRDSLRGAGLTVLAQGMDGTPGELIDRLRRRPRTVVLGTQSFWEGVDVAGEALSLLVIAKLPFAVPTEPITAARAERLERPFMEYSLPQALLRFKQGFGRLIRTRTDRGVVVLLDRRVVTKRYGRAFFDSLPGCRVVRAPLHECVDATSAFLAGVTQDARPR